LVKHRQRHQSRVRKEPVREKAITFVGMDAHKVAIKLAVLLPGETKPVEWQLANEKAAVRRMVRKVQRLAPGEVRFCYEAGPCGYALQRWIQEAGAACTVIARSLKARYRLHRRFNRLLAKGKPRSKAVVALARELAGFIWAALPLEGRLEKGGCSPSLFSSLPSFGGRLTTRDGA
jgi:hypothetical protein